MDFINLAQYDDEKGLDLDQTIREMHKRNMRPPTLFELDNRLIHTDQWKKEKKMYPCRSGTFMAYEKLDVPLAKTIDWYGYKVIVPKKFQGKKDIALVCNFEDFKYQNKTFSSDKFVAIQLPKEDGWYDFEKKFGIPIGEKKGYADNRKYLWRRTDPYIGLLVRGYYGFVDYGRQGVDADFIPARRYGVFGIATGNPFKVNPTGDEKFYSQPTLVMLGGITPNQVCCHIKVDECGYVIPSNSIPKSVLKEWIERNEIEVHDQWVEKDGSKQPLIFKRLFDSTGLLKFISEYGKTTTCPRCKKEFVPSCSGQEYCGCHNLSQTNTRC